MKLHRLLCLSIAMLVGGCFDPQTTVIPAGTARVAFQSQCAQLVVECTSSWPTAVIQVMSNNGTVMETDDGFLIETSEMTAMLDLIGSQSMAGSDATIQSFAWSFGASDNDPCTLTPGTEFAIRADTSVLLEKGFHYIRLRVENDVIRDRIESEQCGLIGTDVASYDFVEVEIEVR